MILSRRAFCITANYFIKCSSRSPSMESYLENKFTNTEQDIILAKLNSSSAEELSKFNLTQTRSKNLVNWKNKKGPFISISDILEVDGLAVNILDKLCQSILSGDTSTTVNKPKNKGFLIPTLTSGNAKCLMSAIGFHIESTGISWAKLERCNNELTSWNYCNFSTLPKKNSLMDTFNLAVEIMNSIPQADVYIFENKYSNTLSKNPTKSSGSSHQLELASMLLALINTHEKNVLEVKQPVRNNYANKVYFLRSHLPARLFGVLIGSERVSAENIVLDIISGKTGGSLPCSKVLVESELINEYCKCSKGYKDLLEQALLLVVTFMDLCIYNNPVSHGIINKSKK